LLVFESIGVLAPVAAGSPTSVHSLRKEFKKTPLLAAEGFMILKIQIQAENSKLAQKVILICLTPRGG
jgi:hypothetical protein